MSSLKVHDFFHHGFHHGKKRSKSLTNIHDDPALHEKSGSSSGSNLFKNLKVKLNEKISKSNSNLAIDEGDAEVKDSSKLGFSFLRSSTSDLKRSPRPSPRNSPRFKHKHSDKLERRSQPELNDRFNSDVELNFQSRPRSDTLESSEHSLAACVGYLDCTSEHDEADRTALANQEIEKLHQKIEKTKREIIQLQDIRKANVTKYLNTSDNSVETNAKLKVNFERSNQKTNSSIHVLQKKLEKYLHHVKDLEDGVQSSKKIIQVVQDSVRSGASSITDAVSKPLLESLNSLITSKREKTASESNDSIYITVTDEEELDASLPVLSDEEGISSPSSEVISSTMMERFRQRSAHVSSDDMFDAIKSRIGKLEKENEDLRGTVDQLKESLNHIFQSLQEESYKTKQLQGQLNDIFNQWNDLTELHQNEMKTMKNEMDQTLEYIEKVEYRFVERTGDLEEDLQNCVTNLSKIEKQQDEHTINNLLDMNAKMLLSKFLSFLINICVFILFVITSLTKCIMPFISDKSRLVASGIGILAIIIIWKSFVNQ